MGSIDHWFGFVTVHMDYLEGQLRGLGATGREWPAQDDAENGGSTGKRGVGSTVRRGAADAGAPASTLPAGARRRRCRPAPQDPRRAVGVRKRSILHSAAAAVPPASAPDPAQSPPARPAARCGANRHHPAQAVPAWSQSRARDPLPTRELLDIHIYRRENRIQPQSNGVLINHKPPPPTPDKRLSVDPAPAPAPRRTDVPKSASAPACTLRISIQQRENEVIDKNTLIRCATSAALGTPV